MALSVPVEYVGTKIPSSTLAILPVLAKHGFSLILRRNATKTIRIMRASADHGYINSDVIGNQGIFGYHFRTDEKSADACPEHLGDRLVPEFCKHYRIESAAVKILDGKGSNTGKKYLIITDPKAAIKVLIADADGPDDLVVVESGKKFVEGRIAQVVSTRRERNPAARDACLKAHGFDCYVCGVNLKKSYKGLVQELVHVHHEEPLSGTDGEYEFDPVVQMKPVCPNCHAVIHSKTPPYSVDEVKQML